MLLVFLEAKFVSLTVGLLLVTSTEIQKKMKNQVVQWKLYIIWVGLGPSKMIYKSV